VAIYLDDTDRQMFLVALAEAYGHTGWRCLAEVLTQSDRYLPPPKDKY